jgi:hypothetical protein
LEIRNTSGNNGNNGNLLTTQVKMHVHDMSKSMKLACVVIDRLVHRKMESALMTIPRILSRWLRNLKHTSAHSTSNKQDLALLVNK